MAKWTGLVGVALITEALLVAAARLLTFVYTIAGEAYISDESKVPFSALLPWLLVTIALIGVLLWAGVRFRSTPDGPWSGARLAGRIAIVAALAINVAMFVRAIVGVLASFDGGVQVPVAWALLGTLCGAVSVGIVATAGFLGSRNEAPGAGQM